MAIDDEAGEPEKNEVQLNDDEKKLIEEAKDYINKIEEKIITRAKIKEIKDPEDDLVDLKRIVHILIDFVVSDWENKSEEFKQKSEIKTVMDLLINDFKNDEYKGLFDIQSQMEKIEHILNTETEICSIVEDYYFSNNQKGDD